MLVKHPQDVEDIVVSKDGRVLAYHILHTMKYTEDARGCSTYLHHKPDVGDVHPRRSRESCVGGEDPALVSQEVGRGQNAAMCAAAIRRERGDVCCGRSSGQCRRCVLRLSAREKRAMLRCGHPSGQCGDVCCGHSTDNAAMFAAAIRAETR